MKNIKLLFMLIAVLGIKSISHAQTKEESLEWLKTNASLAFVPLKPISSSVPENYTEEEWKKDLYELGSRIEYLTQDSIKFWSNWGGGNIKFDEILYEENLEKIEKINVNDFQGVLISIKLTNNRYIPYYVSPEKETDVNRVLKAIMHIAKLSGAKENKQIF